MFCNCKKCKKMRREGKILGRSKKSFWVSWFGKMEYYDGPVSDYVYFPKFMKGRIRKEKWPEKYMYE